MWGLLDGKSKGTCQRRQLAAGGRELVMAKCRGMNGWAKMGETSVGSCLVPKTKKRK